jgi:phenylpyruvate tautomerase PptA (4-oxalocrotonate tautomerase family)
MVLPRQLADKLTTFHAEYAGVPTHWVHIVFHEYLRGNGFTAGRPSPTAALTLLIRTGRSADYKREMLRRLWSLVQAATGAPDDEIVLGIQEFHPVRQWKWDRSCPTSQAPERPL